MMRPIREASSAKLDDSRHTDASLAVSTLATTSTTPTKRPTTPPSPSPYAMPCRGIVYGGSSLSGASLRSSASTAPPHVSSLMSAPSCGRASSKADRADRVSSKDLDSELSAASHEVFTSALEATAEESATDRLSAPSDWSVPSAGSARTLRSSTASTIEIAASQVAMRTASTPRTESDRPVVRLEIVQIVQAATSGSDATEASSSPGSRTSLGSHGSASGKLKV